MADFSKSYKSADFEKAMKMRDDLIDNENVPKDELDKVHVGTHKLFKSHFSFPEVAKNDFSADQLDSLEIAEKNFNADLDDK